MSERVSVSQKEFLISEIAKQNLYLRQSYKYCEVLEIEDMAYTSKSSNQPLIHSHRQRPLEIWKTD